MKKAYTNIKGALPQSAHASPSGRTFSESPEITCPYCKSAAKLVTGEHLYPHRPDLSSLHFWCCDPCDAYVGTHKNSKRYAPLGQLSNSVHRKAKSAAHRAFDPLWKGGRMERGDAYQWLAIKLGIAVKRCHIGMFDIETCGKVVTICKSERGIV